MITKWIEKESHYDGTQLRPLFAYLSEGILGDSVVAWRGSCDVNFAHMIDGEDLLLRSEIRGSDMIHFIIEVFDQKLMTGVALQRLFASHLKEVMNEVLPAGQELVRDGDDLYFGEKKLSISIATVSHVSTLIHFAYNVSNAGTPVTTCACEDWDLDPRKVAEELMSRFATEFASIKRATQKVRPV
jgi:uncharacterized protein